MNKLPDGSGFFVASFPLPKDHWLYAPSPDGWDEMRDCMPDQPVPILTHAQRGAVVAAVRYAIRGATMRGTEPDFDPDALVQNAVVALCGPYGLDAPQPDSVPQDSGERAAFEHWAFTVRRYRRGNTVQGGYISPPVNGAWEGWKAALAPKTAVATHKPLSDDERIGTYRHLKTLVIYDLVAIAHLESDKTEMVVYRSWFTGNVWLRPVAEFFDGRFERFGNPTATIEASR